MSAPNASFMTLEFINNFVYMVDDGFRHLSITQQRCIDEYNVSIQTYSEVLAIRAIMSWTN